MAINNLCITGHLGRDAEHKSVGETDLLSFSVAGVSGWGDKKKTVWVNCAFWGNGAKADGFFAGVLVKGQKVCVSGELSVEEYTNKNDEERQSLSLRVNQIELFSQGEGQGKTSGKPKEDPYGDDVPF